MKIFRTLFYTAVTASLVGAGMFYERHKCHKQTQYLENKITELQSIDHTVESIILQHAYNPERVDKALQNFEQKYLTRGGKNE